VWQGKQTMGYIRQLLKIIHGTKEIITENGFDFEGSFDYDEICGELSFTLPYSTIDTATGDLIDFKSLQRYDMVQLFFKEFPQDPGYVDINSLTMIFDGYINEIKLSRSKGDYPYNITCLGILGIANERGVSQFNWEFGGPEAFNILLQRAGMQTSSEFHGIDYIPANKIIANFTLGGQNLQVKWEGGKLLKDILDNIRERYGIRAHYQGDGYLHLFQPLYFFSTKENPVDITVWDFDLTETKNVISVDYGELTMRYNTVVVHYGLPGQEGVAIALDPTTYNTNVDIAGEENSASFSIYHAYRQDVTNYDDATGIAKNLLLGLIRNKKLNLTVAFNPAYCTTQWVRFNDGEIYKNAYFIIKRYSYTISKDDVKCVLYCEASTLAQLPDDFIISPSSINDIHVLQIEKDISDATGWNVFNV
jgi:hypothetical protein